MKKRILVWFSCGGPSAMAAKLAIKLYGGSHEVLIVNCDTRPSEHEDNYRFSKECEAWFGQPITYIFNDSFATVDDVFEKTRYMSGIDGARCTTELKKIPRQNFAHFNDIHVFGFTAEEKDRAEDFRLRNPELQLLWILIEQQVTRQMCMNAIAAAGIREPAMYALGFNNNNCPGCVKASSPWYWDMIRTHFPAVFLRRCQQSRKLGVRLIQCTNEVIAKLPLHVQVIGEKRRIFLDELPPGPFKRKRKKENLSCGPECGASK